MFSKVMMSRTNFRMKMLTNVTFIFLNTEGAKSQYPYVGLNNSVTEYPIEIIFSGMTYYHH